MVFSAIVVIGIIVIYFLCQNSESKAVSQEVAQIRTALSYDRTGKLLILKSRTSNIRNVIKAEASHDINLTSVPDKLVYTGATVGGGIDRWFSRSERWKLCITRSQNRPILSIVQIC